MERHALLDRARNRGVNPAVYWPVRAVLQTFFHLYFRMSRIGREHIPQDGPVIIAANHRSFLDPFVIGCMVRRPCYFIAKKELFERPLTAWLLNALGAFPIDRGASDADAMGTARAILERGDCVVIFPEGTRVRPGGLGSPRRGVGRLALETGAPVVPVAVIGTEDVRRGWRIRPHEARIRAGRPLRFPRVEAPNPRLAGAVTDRIWPMVALQWEWLGGPAPLRRVAVIGAGTTGARLAAGFHRAGATVAVGTRSTEQAVPPAPAGPAVVPAAQLDLEAADLVVLAVPARALPAVVAAHGGRIGRRAGVLVAAPGLVPPMATLPSAFVAERVAARSVASLTGPTGSYAVASSDQAFAAQVCDLLRRSGSDAEPTREVAAAELAAAAAQAALTAAAAAGPAGAGAAGAAVGRVFAEVADLGRRMGAGPAGLPAVPGVGALAEQLARPRAGDEADVLPLLAYAMREHRVAAPVTSGLAEVVEGRRDAAAWAAGVAARGSGRRAA